jgi:hypothetical protein
MITKDGVCILIKDNTIQFQYRKHFEACTIKMSINKMKLHILCLQKGADGDFNKFIEQLDSTQVYLESKKLELIKVW